MLGHMLNYPVLIGGIALLWLSADIMVRNMVTLANKLRIPAFTVGVIMGFATSAPEFVVSVIAAIAGNPRLGIGNALGSNIANIGLVLGIGAIMTTIALAKKTIAINFSLLGIATVLLGTLMALGSRLDRVDGMILIACLIPILWQMARSAPQEIPEESASPMTGREIWRTIGIAFVLALVAGAHAYLFPLTEMTRAIIFLPCVGALLYFELRPPAYPAAAATPKQSHALLWLVMLSGLALLIIASNMVVTSAVSISRALGIDEIIIGLSVIALGTSLPELATVIASLWKKRHDIAVGNILSSNIFNALGVIGAAALAHPLAIDSDIMTRDFAMGAGLTLLLLLMILMKPSGRLSAKNGGILLACFAGYIYWLYYSELVLA